MYESIKDWMDVPVTIKPFVKRTGTGDKEYGEPFSTTCYPHSEIKTIVDRAGVEVISSNQLYIDGATSIADMDAIMFEDKEREIKSISTFYRGGVPDIRVVYI